MAYGSRSRDSGPLHPSGRHRLNTAAASSRRFGRGGRLAVPATIQAISVSPGAQKAAAIAGSRADAPLTHEAKGMQAAVIGRAQRQRRGLPPLRLGRRGRIEVPGADRDAPGQRVDRPARRRHRPLRRGAHSIRPTA
ncbi:hypothetical protein QTI33_31535 [Variovorax sp. J22P271]|uniref:hypothetical protein n=1 Tax=Variovorax davisae TaxID=3053515 RepID=UPI002574960F|nr:hypothetical protein [Variovorax sp. J22P271]MDM0036705.1 hypothetical protein [Variovorax sp. J22P271]